MITVPVHVPFGSDVGSAAIVNVRPCGVMTPDVGKTESHGRSAVATNVVVPPGRPATKSWKEIGVVLPAGAMTLGLSALGCGPGTTTTLIGVENGPTSPHGDFARTR